MENEPTNTPDTPGAEPNKAVAPDGQPLSDYDKALALVKRREEANKVETEILERKEKLATNSMLGGTGGGHVDSPLVSEVQKKVAESLEYWKGTQMEKDIKKANE